MTLGIDPLSPLAHRLLKLNDGRAYTLPVVRGAGDPEVKAALELIHPDQLLTAPVTGPDDAGALLAGLWLWHDWLDDSHGISQSLQNSSGSLWHAIMHRREGDFSNSKYWYQRAGDHAIFPAIGANLGPLLNHLPADKSLLRLLRGGWDPAALVDLAEELDRRPDQRLAAFIAVQQLEWRMLFEHCARAAVL